MKKILFFTVLVLALVLSTVNCSLLDVVARDANKSFAKLLENSTTGFNPTTKRWELLGPGAEIFSMVADFSAVEPDIIITFPAAPFLSAGLDTAKLPSRIIYDNASASSFYALTCLRQNCRKQLPTLCKPFQRIC